MIAVLMSASFRTLGMTIVSIGLRPFVVSIGGSLTSYGIIIGTFSLTQCFFQFPFAVASDKYGRRRIVLFGMLIYLIGTFLCFTAQNVVQLIIYRAIQGIGAYSSILQALVGDIYKKNQHRKGMSYYSVIISFGSLLGFVLGGYISSLLGFRNVFLVQVSLIGVSLIFIFFVLKEKNNPDMGTAQNKNIDFSLRNLKILFKERQYIFAVVNSCTRWFLYGFITSYIIWVSQDNAQGFGLSPIASSYLMLLIIGLYVIFMTLSSLILKRVRSRKTLIIGQAIVLMFAGLFFFRDLAMTLPVFIVIVSFFGIGIAFFGPAGGTLMMEVIEDIRPDLKGSGIGFGNTIGFFFMAIAPMIMSPLGQIEILFPFYAVFGLMVVALITSIFLIDKKY
ncbi:MAG: MFS transporter [Promethearchaeota archaeon]